MTEPLAWLSAFAASKGLRYEPDADERWIRAWEPYATLRTPNRYEHALLATGGNGSLTLARMMVGRGAAGAAAAPEAGAWIAIVQDERLAGDARAAATCDRGRVFAEPLDLVPMPRRLTADAAFDRVFASFAPDPAALAAAITPSLRKLVLGWRIPLHFEVRPGGFIVAPVALVAAGAPPSIASETRALDWLLGAVQFFGDKAAKRMK